MKLNVPFYKSEKDTDCGPLALKMALSYLGEEHSFEEIAKEEKQLETGLVWSVGIARAAKTFGFNTKIISTDNFDLDDNDLSYYNHYSNNQGRLILNEIKKEILKLGIKPEKKDLSLDELLEFVSKDSIPIVLVNWFVIALKGGFSGHFLAITGYDKDNVYVHNPGLASPEAYLKIKKSLFLKAWESKGTDKDTIIIFRK